MKATSLKTAALLAGSIALLAGNATAQATSGVVGYETLDYGVGFTALGLRLHETPLAAGTLETVTVTTAEDADVDLGALIVSGTYILEIEDGSGIIQEVTSATGSVLNVADLSGVAPGAAYTLRHAASLATVFGAANESGLVAGNGNTGGADLIWAPDGTGGYNKYYYDNFAPPLYTTAGWAIVDASPAGSSAIDGAATDLIYADGIVMNSAAGGTLVVTGDLKTAETELNLIAGFNFVSSMNPAGGTLAVNFGAGVGLAPGNGNTGGADQIWLPDGAGGYDKYYYDNFAPPLYTTAGWAIVDASPAGSSAVDGSTISLPSGIIVSSIAGGNLVESVPGSYTGL